MAGKVACHFCGGSGELDDDGRTRLALVTEIPGWPNQELAREGALIAVVSDQFQRFHDPASRRRILRYLRDQFPDDEEQ